MDRPGHLIVSILAGKTIADLKRRLPTARAVVRAMPNLPASIGRGATGAVGSPEVGRRRGRARRRCSPAPASWRGSTMKR